MRYSNDQIAEVIHGANCGLQNIHGDPHPSAPWWITTDEIKVNVIIGVEAVRRWLQEPAWQDRRLNMARALHLLWVSNKKSQGWKFGEAKNEDDKTHPCMVPWEKLSPEQQTKNRVFIAIVREMVQEG